MSIGFRDAISKRDISALTVEEAMLSSPEGAGTASSAVMPRCAASTPYTAVAAMWSPGKPLACCVMMSGPNSGAVGTPCDPLTRVASKPDDGYLRG